MQAMKIIQVLENKPYSSKKKKQGVLLTQLLRDKVKNHMDTLPWKKNVVIGLFSPADKA